MKKLVSTTMMLLGLASTAMAEYSKPRRVCPPGGATNIEPCVMVSYEIRPASPGKAPVLQACSSIPSGDGSNACITIRAQDTSIPWLLKALNDWARDLGLTAAPIPEHPASGA